MKPEKNPVTIEDLNLESEYSGISYDLVIDGVILKDNLQKIGKNEDWLKNEVGKFGFSTEDALIVTLRLIVFGR